MWNENERKKESKQQQKAVKKNGVVKNLPSLHEKVIVS